MTRMLVTGGCGYLGTSLIPALALQEGVEEIIIYDNLRRKKKNNKSYKLEDKE